MFSPTRKYLWESFVYKLGTGRDYPNCQHHYPCALGPLLSKIKVTWTQALWYYDNWSDNQDTYWLTNRWDALDKGMILVPGRMELEDARFHHVTQNGMQFKAYELFISGILHLTYSDWGCLWVSETMKSKSMDKGGVTVLGKDR